MKLLTIDTDQGAHPGIIVGDDKVLDLTKAPGSVFNDSWRPTSIREILELGDSALEQIRQIADTVETNMDAANAALSSFSETPLSFRSYGLPFHPFQLLMTKLFQWIGCL